MIELKTKRLVLRQWREEDLKPFAELNADPLVREFFPSVLTAQESDDLVKVFREHIDTNGYSFFSTSLIETGEFIGFVGLEDVNYFTAPFTESPKVEIGWRLSRNYWGKGYATEGALKALEFGFDTLKLPEIVSFTTINNLRSRNVMEKIGMHRDEQDDFDHPKVAVDSPLRRHVLYRLTAQEWHRKNEKI